MNGIEKLVKLLNEREKKEINQTYEWHNLGDFVFADNVQTGQNLDSSESASILIAKKYGFIKRLVNNDKIDESKIEIHWFSFYESVLMELAIKDNPIEFLISILK